MALASKSPMSLLLAAGQFITFEQTIGENRIGMKT
jgi:hypothetical protein